MVSLSTNEMLLKMVENYGYGAYLFSYLQMDQLEKLQQIDPDLDQYMDDLMSNRIYDPEAKQILIQKYKNDRWNHSPKLYKTKMNDKDWKDFEQLVNNMEEFSKKLSSFVNQKFIVFTTRVTNKEFRKGDVLLIEYEDELIGYSIYDQEKFKNVYLRYKDEWEWTEPVPENFDILGNTPSNFWNDIQIPSLSFHFPLNQIFEKIKWSKTKVGSQNYLLGEFTFRKRKSKVYIPLEKSSTQEANKLAIGLQVRKLDIFYPSDPQNKIPSEPSTIFGVIGGDSENIGMIYLEEGME